MSENPLLASLEDASQLELLYHQHPGEFPRWLDEAHRQCPDSPVLRVWQARLDFVAPVRGGRTGQVVSPWFVVFLCLMAGVLIKLPAWVPLIDDDWFYPRFTGLIVIATMAMYFLRVRADPPRVGIFVLASFVVCALYAGILPSPDSADSVLMALVHLPVVAMTLLAVAFMGEEWRKPQARLRYIQYLGEMAIHSVVILVGGVVMTLMTFGLFELIDLSIDDWYMKYVVVIGMVSAPVVATWMHDSLLHGTGRVAAMISRIFSPLVLITVAGYLVALLVRGVSPVQDREALIIFNGLLVGVWAISVYSIAGRGTDSRSRLADAIGIALILCTLVIDAIALTAMVTRLLEQGITPNRTAVLGTNLLIFVHLGLIVRAYVHGMRGQETHPFGAVRQVIAGYLPLYSVWALVVTLVLPLVFRFR